MNKSIPADIFPGLAMAALATMLVIAADTVGAATVKCWTNNEGVKECGATVPPEYAQQEHKEINKQGIVVNVQERAKTDAEIAEAKRQEELAEEERKLAEEKSLHDSVLL